MAEERLYAVRLLWIQDRAGFDEYQEIAKPVLAKHEVHIERWIMTEAMVGHGMDRPDEIVVTWFRDAAHKEAFENDPDFKEAVAIRDKAAKLVTITGRSVFGD